MDLPTMIVQELERRLASSAAHCSGSRTTRTGMMKINPVVGAAIAQCCLLSIPAACLMTAKTIQDLRDRSP